MKSLPENIKKIPALTQKESQDLGGMAGMNKLVLPICILAILSDGDKAMAGDLNDCKGNVSITQKNEYRGNDGLTIIDGPTTDFFSGLTCGNIDGFVWGAYNNTTSNMNELDIGIGYSFSLLSSEDLSARLGVERWQYLENGGKNDVLVASISSGLLPIDLSAKVVKILDQTGTQVTATVSESFDLETVGGFNTTLGLSINQTYLDNFFGTSGHSNTVYGITMSGTKGNLNIKVFTEKHDGKQGLEDSIQTGITFGFNF